MPSFFPLWMVLTHFLNIFFMLLLARSGREWLRFSEKTVGADSRPPWSSLDEEEAWSPVVACPVARTWVSAGTGTATSPSVPARLPRYGNLFGGKQGRAPVLSREPACRTSHPTRRSASGVRSPQVG